MNSESIEELKAEITKVAARIAHLGERARGIEHGDVEVRHKYDAEDALVGRDETTKVHHNSAVAYWKEVRESEKRLDGLRAELRELTAAAACQRIDVHIHLEAAPAEER